jgi:hypothetical protein
MIKPSQNRYGTWELQICCAWNFKNKPPYLSRDKWSYPYEMGAPALMTCRGYQTSYLDDDATVAEVPAWILLLSDHLSPRVSLLLVHLILLVHHVLAEADVQ